MPQELIVPSALMTLAFVFYTAGVFAERVARNLYAWHAGLFWAGLACDAAGTEMMRRLIEAGQTTTLVHTVTGAAAFVLMAAHALWATWTLTRGSADARRGFHRYSIAVWALWLVPYLGGMAAGITHG